MTEYPPVLGGFCFNTSVDWPRHGNSENNKPVKAVGGGGDGMRGGSKSVLWTQESRFPGMVLRSQITRLSFSSQHPSWLATVNRTDLSTYPDTSHSSGHCVLHTPRGLLRMHNIQRLGAKSTR